MPEYIQNKVQKELRFIGYCVEIYKKAKGMTGRAVSDLFKKYGVWSYIYDCYGALHTTGPQYTVEDIDLFIAARAG